MDWSGIATVLGARRHGESSVILTAFARDAGIVAGALPGGTSPKRAAMIQPGSVVALRWRARVEGQLGTFAAEPERMRPGLLAERKALAGVNAITALLGFALPERDPHPRLHDATEDLLDRMDGGGAWTEAYLGWELRLLDEMGFGLDLSQCAVTGQREGLAFVSPRTGRAVSRGGAGEWIDRLLPLPPILGGSGNGGLSDAFALTGHFLRQQLAEAHAARPLPPARDRLVTLLTRPEMGCPPRK